MKNSTCTQIFYGIDQLPLFSSLITDSYQGFEKQYRDLLKAKDSPHAIDSGIVNRIKKSCERNIDLQQAFSSQFNRWLQESLNHSQRLEIGKLNDQLNAIKGIVDSILTFVRFSEGKNIDRILTKDDAELGT